MTGQPPPFVREKKEMELNEILSSGGISNAKYGRLYSLADDRGDQVEKCLTFTEPGRT